MSTIESSSGLTRRGFLKGAGVAATAAAIGDASLEAMGQEQAAENKIIGPGATKITLRVNGENRPVEIEPRTTLADALRGNLDLTGTKVVCDRGSCSACTVWVDGTPVCSCMTLALDARGKEIKTIEGLAQGEKLHPVQEQFIEHDALQCGFCTPGMIMSCAALLEKNKSPKEEDVKEATRGNLCRCGTYPKVVAATVAAGKVMSGGGQG
ncbi:MAG TPA: (2Fe-2S)-binding protein [Tepidisphaeraceae bacterium]|jgi:aerobic-type carbon monoxide dehydrogenase small subunit (CoxS/CutS family)